MDGKFSLEHNGLTDFSIMNLGTHYSVQLNRQARWNRNFSS